jgi:hypothetical protein
MTELALECHPEEAQCRALAQRITGSKDFIRASRLREFLLYAVDRKLTGHPEELTEAIIGHRVFGRSPSYNTGEDSIVRTEARILRQRLEAYFANAGQAEPVILEIPKGSYVPVFRYREAPVENPAPSQASAKTWTRPAILALAGTLLILILVVAGGMARRLSSGTGTLPLVPIGVNPPGSIDLESSDADLVRAFREARSAALSYVYTGDPVGDWYRSTAGNRQAFCMRDASHQSVGAAALGLAGHTRNMLRHFAASVSASRDFCGFWEINKDGFPAPVDYKDDGHFWYCLPANFDVMQACYRQYLWTGDPTYFDATFSSFYDRTTSDYVARWDDDRDGLMEGHPRARPRGIPSYYQQEPNALIGADLVAAQYRGYLAYAAIEEAKGAAGSLSRKLAEEYRAKAQALRTLFGDEWWDPQRNRYYSLMLADHKFSSKYVADANAFALLFGLTEDGPKTEAALDNLETNGTEYDQTLSYFPEILFENDRNESAYTFLLRLADPGFKGHGMPEVVFAVVGAIVTGLAGVTPDAPHHMLETLSRLPQRVGRVKLTHLPVLDNSVAVEHRGLTETSVTNQSGPAFRWKARFPVALPADRVGIVVDGRTLPAVIESSPHGRATASVSVRVGPGQSATARVVTLRR